MTTKQLLPLVGLLALVVSGTGRSQPPTAPAPRPVPDLRNLTFTYRDMRTATLEEYEAWVRDLPVERLPAVLSALKAQRGELEKKEAIVQERLKAIEPRKQK